MLCDFCKSQRIDKTNNNYKLSSMKQFLTAALLCCLCVPAAMSQSVTIVDKDGVTHTFPTSNVEEITFVESGDINTYTYENLMVRVYNSSNIGFEFSGKGMPNVNLDTYGPSQSYLTPGTYIVSDDASLERRIDTYEQFTNVETNGNKVGIVGGEMVVEDGPEGTYLINFEFTLNDGSEIKGVWSGFINNYGKVINLKADAARQSYLSQFAPGQMRIAFNDNSWSYEAAIDFYLQPLATTLSPGIYTYTKTPTYGQFECGGSGTYIVNFNPYETWQIESGEVYVQSNRVEVRFILEDGREAYLNYEGDINYSAEVPVNTLNSLYTSVYNQGAYIMDFTGPDATIRLKAYSEEGADNIVPGTYKVTQNYGIGDRSMTVNAIRDNSFVVINGENVTLSGGYMLVEENKGSYNIYIDFSLNNGTNYRAKYTGVLPAAVNIGDEVFETIELAMAIEAKRSYINNAQPGEFFMKLNDQGWSYYMALDFFASPDATYIPSGTYTFSANPTVGNIGPESYVELYSPSYTSPDIVGGQVVVTANADGTAKYVITATLSDDRYIKCTFEGTPNYKEP